MFFYSYMKVSDCTISINRKYEIDNSFNQVI